MNCCKNKTNWTKERKKREIGMKKTWYRKYQTKK